MPAAPIRLALVLSLLLVPATAGCRGETSAADTAGAVKVPRGERQGDPPAAHRPIRPFSPDSVWNRPLRPTARVDSRSPAIVAHLAAEVDVEKRETGGPALNTSSFSVPVYRVPAVQPTVKVHLRKGASSQALRLAWREVPLPPQARPAAGTDHHLVVWQPSADRLWEFWKLRGGPRYWEAQWGGAIDRVSESPGVYGPSAWAGATRWWGASASSLSIAGGLITIEDLQLGKIDHALAMAVPDPRANFYTAPARRTDGWSLDRLSLPEGAHLRLDPRLDLDRLRLPRITRLIAEAAQKYGLIVRDGAGNVSLYAEDPTPAGVNPYTEPPNYFEGRAKPLAAFPWHHLQLLKMRLRPNR
jgi:hypothetical protein